VGAARVYPLPVSSADGSPHGQSAAPPGQGCHQQLVAPSTSPVHRQGHGELGRPAGRQGPDQLGVDLLWNEVRVFEEAPEPAQPMGVLGRQGEEAGDAREAAASPLQQAIGHKVQVLQAGAAHCEREDLLDKLHEFGVRYHAEWPPVAKDWCRMV